MKKIIVLTLSLLTITLVSKAQVEIVSAGTSGAYTVTVPGTFVLTNGLQVTFKAHTANTAGATLSVSGTVAKNITKLGGSNNIGGSDILANQIVTVAYDGTNWQMISALGSTPAASNDWTTTGNSGTNAATNYIGTSDPTDLSFRTNGVLKARLTQKGQLEILNTGASTFIGESAGANDDLNNRQNVFIGDFAGTATTSGNWNTALGYDALGSNITGTSNTAIGRTTLSYSTGSNNTATGTYSLFWGTTGSGNTATGTYAGQTIKIGSNNTFLGYFSDATDSSLTNATAIGYNAKVGQSNSLVLGGTGADIVNVGIGTVTPNERLHVVGDINVSNAIKLNGDPGTAGQVLTSGGGGGANTWSTPAASVNIYNSNGTLTAARTVTQGANTLAFTATSVNAFSIDGSTFSVDATNNNVGIGTSTPSEKLHVTGGQIYNNWSSLNGPANVFIRNWNSVSGPGYNTGTLGQVTIVTSDAAESKYAIQGYAGGDGGNKTGVYGASMGLGTNFGGYFSANGGSTNYALYAVGNAAGTSNAYGIYSTVQGNGSGTTYGVYGQNSSSSTGATYAGNFENFNSTGSIIYGVRSSLTGNAGGTVTKYGMRSDVIGTASSNIGGYFRAVGGTTNHAIQLVDGSEANNRVLASDAAGNATWTDLTALSSGSTAWTRFTPNIYPTTLTDNVGIGTASPSERLEVSGNIEVTGATDQFMINNTRALNMNGTENVFVGNNAASGSYSTIIGYQAGNVNTGISNTFVGRQSGLANSSGGQNAFYGIQSGAGNTTGQYNTFIGRSAGLTNSTGSNNTIIGGTANVSSGILTNATAIGYGAIVSASNALVLGNNVSVGIGTSTPSTNLDIVSTNTGGTGMQVSNTSVGGRQWRVVSTGSTSVGGAGKFQIYDNTGGTDMLTIDAVNGGEIGIGLSSTMSGRLHVLNSTATWSTYNNAVYGEVTGTTTSSRGVMGISWATGTYGIGTYGSAQGAAANNYGVYGYATGGTTTNYAGYFDAGNVYVTNNLGIGVAPLYPFHVSTSTDTYGAYVINSRAAGGNYALRTSCSSTGGSFNVGAYIQATGASTTNYGLYAVASGATTNWAVYTSGDTYVGGQLGVQNATPTFAIDLPNSALIGAGQGRANAWTIYSDKRLKDNIKDIPYGLQTVLDLTPLMYNQHNSSIDSLGMHIEKGSAVNIGFLAQDLYKVVPQVVSKPEDETKDFWAVDYSKLVPVLTKAIQEQQAQIEELRKEINLLKNK